MMVLVFPSCQEALTPANETHENTRKSLISAGFGIPPLMVSELSSERRRVYVLRYAIYIIEAGSANAAVVIPPVISRSLCFNDGSSI